MRITDIIDRENPILRIITIRILQRHTTVIVAAMVLNRLQQFLRPRRSDGLRRPLRECTRGFPTVDLLARGCRTGEASPEIARYAGKIGHSVGEAERIAAAVDAQGFASFEKVRVFGWGGSGLGREKEGEGEDGGEGWDMHDGSYILLGSDLVVAERIKSYIPEWNGRIWALVCAYNDVDWQLTKRSTL